MKTLNIKTVSITTLNITTLSITTLSITTLSITTLSITTFSITILSVHHKENIFFVTNVVGKISLFSGQVQYLKVRCLTLQAVSWPFTTLVLP
jgi:hypothetical protein